MHVEEINQVLEAALADLKTGDEGAIARLTEALSGLGVQVGGDMIAVGDISDASGIAIGRNIRQVIFQTTLPAELEMKLEGVLDQLTRRKAALFLDRPVRVFLASPADVADERALAFNVFDKLAYDPLLRDRLRVESVAWDKPATGTPLLATMTPQEAIKKGLPKPSECDIAVVILWSRMGTPLPEELVKPESFRFLRGTKWEARYLSGTEWEYVDAMQVALERGKPYVLVYRRTEEPRWGPSDPRRDEKIEQWEQVNAFFNHFTNPDGSIRQGYNPYSSPSDFQEQLEFHLRDLLARLLEEAQEAERLLPSLEAQAEAVPLWEGSPFPGLRPFGPEDAPIFFGRGLETDDLVLRLVDPASRFLAVVGASGSGKSSLVGAGLLPRLAGGAIEGSRDWVVVRFTPDELGARDPFASLAAALQKEPLQITKKGLAAKLREDPGALVELCSEALPATVPWAEVLLFIDQFEELFTRARIEDQEAFMGMLDQASCSEKLRTIVTLRADLYHRCLEHPALAALVNEGTYNLPVPQRDALREMIQRPAERAGLSFEPGLVKRILDDTGDEPGRLALMAFALEQLFEARQNERLTLTAYKGFGGVEGSIGEQARAAFESLDQEAQGALPQVFESLIEIDREGIPTRRRSKLPAVAKGEAAGRLVEALAEKRLLVYSKGEGETPVVEVAHEAIFVSWPRLATWIDANRENLRIQRELRDAAEEWVSQGRDSSYLYRGGQLETATKWASIHPDALTSTMQAFLSTSRRRARWARAGIALTLTLIIGAIAAIALIQSNAAQDQRQAALEMERIANTAIAAGQEAEAQREEAIAAGQEAEAQREEAIAQRDEAERQRQISLSSQLAAQAVSLLNVSDANVALLLAIEAVRAADKAEAINALRQALAHRGRVFRTIHAHSDSIWQAIWSADESRILTVGCEQTGEFGCVEASIRMWDVETGAEIAKMSGHTMRINQVRWNSDESLILSAAQDGTARVWDSDTGEELLNLPADLLWVDQVSWNADESQILTVGASDTAKVWDAETGEELLTLEGHEALDTLAFWNADENLILTTSDADTREISAIEGTTRIWDASTGQQLFLFPGDGAIWNVDGSRILTFDEEGPVHLWDTDTGTELLTLLGHWQGVKSALWNLDESQILTSGTDGTARVWNARTGDELFNLNGHESNVISAVWNSDESRILTASLDGTSRTWDAETGSALLIIPGYAPKWSPDETRILTTSGDGAAQVWNAASGQEILTLSGSAFEIKNSNWSSDQSLILTTSADGSVLLWDAVNGIEPLTFSSHEGSVYQAIWFDNENRILTAGEDDIVRAWDVASGNELWTTRGSKIWLNADGSQIMTAAADGILRILDSDTGTMLSGLSSSMGRMIQAQWYGDESRILAISDVGSVHLWDAITSQELLSFPAHMDQIWSAILNRDESLILTVGCERKDEDGVCVDGLARVWDAMTGAERFSLSGSLYVVDDATWNADGSLILTSGCDKWVDESIGFCDGGTAYLWDTNTGQELFKLHADDFWITMNARFNRDQSQILTMDYYWWDQRGRAKAWEAETGEALLTFAGHSDRITQAIWNSDESQIMTAGEDDLVLVWDALTGEELLTLQGARAWWNEDESRILTASMNGTVRIWDTKTGEELSKLSGHSDRIWSLVWTADESHLLTAGADGNVNLWHTQAEDLVEIACQQAHRNMSLEEWKRFLKHEEYRQTCTNIPIEGDE